MAVAGTQDASLPHGRRACSRCVLMTTLQMAPLRFVGLFRMVIVKEGIPAISYPEGFLNMSDEDLFHYAVDAWRRQGPPDWQVLLHRRCNCVNLAPLVTTMPRLIPDADYDVVPGVGTPAGTGCILGRLHICWYDDPSFLPSHRRRACSRCVQMTTLPMVPRRFVGLFRMVSVTTRRTSCPCPMKISFSMR